MANPDHEAHLRRGVEYWNSWRNEHSEVLPDLCGLDLAHAKLSGANLARADLSRACLVGADLSDCDLRGANLTGADVELAYLHEANAEGAILIDASFDGSNLAYATFRNANLTNANLSGVTLEETVFAGANLTEAEFTDTHFERYVRFCDDDYQNPATVARANFTRALITPSDSMDGHTALLGCEGLEAARFNQEDFLTQYLEGALDFLVSEWGPRDPARLDQEIARIRALFRLFPRTDVVPAAFLEIREVIVAEIMRLKNSPGRLYELDPIEFERVVAELLRSFGWHVEMTKRTRDGGYDIFGVHTDLSGIRSSWIVECKRFAAERKVGVDIVRNLFGVKRVLEQGANAMLATTSHFSEDALRFKTSRYDLEYRDFQGIVDWINVYKPNPGGKILVRENTIVLPDS